MPTSSPRFSITFRYYRDIQVAEAFYRDTLGLDLVIDQGWTKIFKVSDDARVGLVGDTKGVNNRHAKKHVPLCLCVPNVRTWYDRAKTEGLANLSEMVVSEGTGIRAFVFDDPEGYQIEVQSPTRRGA